MSHDQEPKPISLKELVGSDAFRVVAARAEGLRTTPAISAAAGLTLTDVRNNYTVIEQAFGSNTENELSSRIRRRIAFMRAVVHGVKSGEISVELPEQSPQELTGSELKVMQAMAQEYTHKRVSCALGITEETARTTISQITGTYSERGDRINAAAVFYTMRTHRPAINSEVSSPNKVREIPLFGLEPDIADLIAQGYRSKEIAAILGITSKEVDTIKGHFIRRTGMRSQKPATVEVIKSRVLSGVLSVERDPATRSKRLTQPRSEEVAKLMFYGISNAQMEFRLNMRSRTLKVRKQHVLNTFGAKTDEHYVAIVTTQLRRDMSKQTR